ncbi:unnamed protein product [Cuscuta europaea]|uniref:Acyl-coenzyme A oxidase n=1 Tax=Cuscuta europaea TaxID=41803 RepID=A0A9P0Z0L0_CUSEU|nr:unnamed protein product [Cuscuta europaea]
MESTPSLSSTEKLEFRTRVLTGHLNQPSDESDPWILKSSPCLSYTPPELSEKPAAFDVSEMRKLMDGHNLQDRDWIYGVMIQSKLFNPIVRGGKVFVGADYNQTMEEQRELTMRRIEFLSGIGLFRGWLTDNGPEAELRKLSFLEVTSLFDHSLSVKLGVHFLLWGGAIQFLGTKRHHDKWLRDSENYVVSGCFAMTELGHGSNVRGIETVTTYDPSTREFIINTPCESAQKYWIGGAANHATHTIVLSQLLIGGKNEGVHAFIAQIRDTNGNICPNIRIADCGHKIGLNGVDNGRIWFDNLRVPRENLLNLVADVTSDGEYVSAIKDPDQRFGALMAPLTTGRVTIPTVVTYAAKVGLATAIRYSLTRRAFSVTPYGPEVLLLDYPSHQRRLLPLLAKTYAMSLAASSLKMMYVKRTPEVNKTIHVVSSALKATLSWHNMRTLQECREACGGQGIRTENRIGQSKSDYDVNSTFEGDNNVLMQQVSKALLSVFVACKRKGIPFEELGLEHMNESSPVIPFKLSNDTLRSIQFQSDVFCLRERELLKRFASEVSEHQARGESKESALLLSHQIAGDLGKAFADLSIYRAFLEAEASVKSGLLKNVLGLVRSMFVMVSLDEDITFLRYRCITPDNATAVREELATLCMELRPHALALVTSFGIPDAFLGPVAFDWVDANAWS